MSWGESAPNVAVVGLGRVGLPTALLFARRGSTVVGVDTDRKKLRSIRSGRSPVPGVDDAALRKALEQGFRLSDDFRAIGRSKAILLCVPDSNGRRCLLPAASSVAAVLTAGQSVVVMSTVTPGTTHGPVRQALEQGGLQAGVDFSLGYSPERFNPGDSSDSSTRGVRLVAGLTQACLQATDAIVGAIWKTVPVPTIDAAEAAKVFENAFRSVNIALANEFFDFCLRSGIEPSSAFSSAATKEFGFMSFRPSVAIGGHCIDVAPAYLLHANSHGRLAGLELLRTAEAVNQAATSRSAAIVRRFFRATIRGRTAKLLLLGTSYKPNFPDDSNSPAARLIRELDQEGIDISVHDPFLSSLTVANRVYRSVVDLATSMRDADLVVLVQPHSWYSDELLSNASSLFDPNAVHKSSNTVLDSVLKEGRYGVEFT